MCVASGSILRSDVPAGPVPHPAFVTDDLSSKRRLKRRFAAKVQNGSCHNGSCIVHHVTGQDHLPAAALGHPARCRACARRCSCSRTRVGCDDRRRPSLGRSSGRLRPAHREGSAVRRLLRRRPSPDRRRPLACRQAVGVLPAAVGAAGSSARAQADLGRARLGQPQLRRHGHRLRRPDPFGRQHARQRPDLLPHPRAHRDRDVRAGRHDDRPRRGSLHLSPLHDSRRRPTGVSLPIGPERQRQLDCERFRHGHADLAAAHRHAALRRPGQAKRLSPHSDAGSRRLLPCFLGLARDARLQHEPRSLLRPHARLHPLGDRGRR